MSFGQPALRPLFASEVGGQPTAVWRRGENRLGRTHRRVCRLGGPHCGHRRKGVQGQESRCRLGSLLGHSSQFEVVETRQLELLGKTLLSEITDTIKKVTETYKCNPLEGVLSHNVSKFFLDGNACIINKETFD